jgi:nicotinamidase-related amidase
MKKLQIISVDLQHDFTVKGGICYEERPSVNFVKETLLPFLAEKDIKIAEIISDYRQPRPGDRGDSRACNPGTWGYESEIPETSRFPEQWIKCMNNPIWIRENIGDPNKEPGLPYEDPLQFGNWLKEFTKDPEETDIILIGLTLDCCVLSTAQELSMRGYRVHVLEEGVDSFSGKQDEKQQILHGPILRNWVKVIGWNKLKNKLNEYASF